MLEMDMSLLRSAEELTLYVVTQNEQILEMKRTMQKQNAAIEQMKLEIESMKK